MDRIRRHAVRRPNVSLELAAEERSLGPCVVPASPARWLAHYGNVNLHGVTKKAQKITSIKTGENQR